MCWFSVQAKVKPSIIWTYIWLTYKNVSIILQSHADEMCEVKNGFDEKCRELKRMKSSFASIKKQNDDLKLQVKENWIYLGISMPTKYNIRSIKCFQLNYNFLINIYM